MILSCLLTGTTFLDLQTRGLVFRFFTLVDRNQPSGENRNNKNSRSPLQRGTEGRMYGLDYQGSLELGKRSSKDRDKR